MNEIVLSLVVSLFLTLFLETGFAFILKKRNKDLLLVVLVNILTNPAVVLLYWLTKKYTLYDTILVTTILETLAILVEAFYYKKFGDQFKTPFLFSLGTNAFSYGMGLLFTWI